MECFQTANMSHIIAYQDGSSQSPFDVDDLQDGCAACPISLADQDAAEPSPYNQPSVDSDDSREETSDDDSDNGPDVRRILADMGMRLVQNIQAEPRVAIKCATCRMRSTTGCLRRIFLPSEVSCPICFDNKRRVMSFPCGHVVCDTCLPQLE